MRNRRSPAISAAAARMRGSCAPCSAPPRTIRRPQAAAVPTGRGGADMTAATAMTLSRRAVLKGAGGGALFVGFALSGIAGPRPAHGQTAGVAVAGGAPAAMPGRVLDASEVDAFLAVHGDGSVTIYTGKVD